MLVSSSVTSPKTRWATCAAASSVLLLAAACGGSTDAQTPSGDAGAKPLTIGFVASLKGEDATGQDGPYQAAMVAVDEINAAGGVNGQPIKTVRVPSPTDPANLTAQLIKIGEQKPDIIVGASPPSLAAISRQVDTLATPIVGTTSYESINGMAAGSKWVFQMLPSDANTVGAAARYTVEGLNAKKVAVLHTNESFGTKGSKELGSVIPALGGTVVTDQAFGPTATDLTGPLLAAKSADAQAIVSWSFPGPQAAAVNALANQGASTPTVGNASISSSVTNGVIKNPAAFDKVYSTLPCNVDDARPNALKFVAAYKAKYKDAVNYSAALYYDAVKLAVTAAKKAPSLDKSKLREALEGLDYKDGACSAQYKSDKTHILTHEATIVGFGPDAKPITKKTYTFDS